MFTGQDFDSMWRTLQSIEGLGGVLPQRLVDLRDARVFMQDVSRGLPDPESIVRAGLHGVHSEAAAQALLDDYIDAMTRKEHAGHLASALDRLTTHQLRDRMLTGAVDEAIEAMRPTFEEQILNPMLAYVNTVPASSQAGAVINMGDDAVQAWREVKDVPQRLRRFISDFCYSLAFSAGVMPNTTEVNVYGKTAAFLVASPDHLREVALATQGLLQSGVNDDPLGRLRPVLGLLRLNTLSEARAVVAQAERAFNPMWSGGTAEEFNAWFAENATDDDADNTASGPGSAEPAPAKSSRAKKPRPSGIVEN